VGTRRGRFAFYADANRTRVDLDAERAEHVVIHRLTKASFLTHPANRLANA
jgi:hypothetical protein